MEVRMEKVQFAHNGRFTLQSDGQLMPDGKFQAAFVINECKLGIDEETKRLTGQMFETEAEAVDIGMQAAMDWLEKYRPVG